MWTQWIVGILVHLRMHRRLLEKSKKFSKTKDAKRTRISECCEHWSSAGRRPARAAAFTLGKGPLFTAGIIYSRHRQHLSPVSTRKLFISAKLWDVFVAINKINDSICNPGIDLSGHTIYIFMIVNKQFDTRVMTWQSHHSFINWTQLMVGRGGCSLYCDHSNVLAIYVWY